MGLFKNSMKPQAENEQGLNKGFLHKWGSYLTLFPILEKTQKKLVGWKSESYTLLPSYYYMQTVPCFSLQLCFKTLRRKAKVSYGIKMMNKERCALYLGNQLLKTRRMENEYKEFQE